MNRISALTTMLAAEPTDAFLLFALAKEYETSGDSDMSLQFYLKCVEYNPDYVGLYYHLGKHYEKIGDLDAAISTYKKGMDVATAANDRHAFSELEQAHWEID